MTEPIFHPALALAELPQGRMRCLTLAGREVLICHAREGVFAVDNTCTHALARMDEGRLRGVRLICPLHGASFDVRDGRVLGAPASRPLPSYPVRVVAGMIEVALEGATAAQAGGG
ncbi:MAG: non-heme iron oxygenase ferredoxin subunit [Gammaproteobacteria bacterium]|nr:non-heme iron oxygenase ferredoxin subunit [Gammaproteobacteria bacterium]MDE2263820.1 non-heme iron oxygenase ferredoxin subunit [Gammaproteobacteria bacterium]